MTRIHLPSRGCLVGLALAVALSASSVVAQDANSELLANEDSHLVHLLQGEELQISQDFVARLDGNKLRLALRDHGISRPVADRNVMVTLVQADAQPQEQALESSDELIFENVKSGLSALIVMNTEAAASAQSMTYAAFAFFAQAPTIAQPNQPQELPEPPEQLATAFEVPVGKINKFVLSPIEDVETSEEQEQLLAVENQQIELPSRFRVTRQPNGALIGRVIIPQEGHQLNPGIVEVVLLSEGVRLATTRSTPDGRFQFDNMPLGFYSVAATGMYGHAAYSFELVDAAVLPAGISEKTDAHNARWVTTQIAAADELIILMIPPALMEQVQQVVRDYLDGETVADNAAPADPALPGAGFGSPAMSGYAGGMGAGGVAGGPVGGGGIGGGGGVLGGTGGLLGVAGLAVGVAALANGDDGFNPPVATPIVGN
ncbi:MAG: hypothetical protein KDB22_13250 [Planctomycetales bacterium]|nr:hypothetical protein [Planctomycetales bacterium]